MYVYVFNIIQLHENLLNINQISYSNSKYKQLNTTIDVNDSKKIIDMYKSMCLYFYIHFNKG